LDRANTSIERTSTQAGGTTVTVRAHYAVPKLPAPPVFVPGGPPPNFALLPNPSRNLPDPRSLFLSFAYTLAPLPSQPMAPRRADQRVGYFTQDYIDFGDDTLGDRRAHLVARWRLEKKESDAALPAEPKEPIRAVLDRNIPEKWREAVRAGVLEWNKAFERAGWRNAIVVEQQPADADWTTVEGTRVLAVRWFAIDGPGATAVGPSQVDPRTGEILRGAAIIPENWVRFDRAVVADLEPRLTGADALDLPAWPAGGPFARRWQLCSYGDEALEQAQFGLQVLAERGAIDPKGPDSERFIAEGLKDVVMHEVGHALGLRHNFRASAGISPAQLRDKSFTATRGVSNSVMDYNAMNLPLEGEPVADYHMPTLGAYDYWAIEYGYREFPAATERQELASLARKSEADPGLAYATDEDVRGIDPLVNQRDLGSDPMAFAQRQMKLARELWTRTQARQVAADDDFTLYRRNLQRGLNSVASVVGMAAKFVGGTFTSRALAGSGQALLVPVPAAQQRGALDLVVGEVFSSASFRFDPKFMSRLGVDQFERTSASPDFSLGAAVLAIQRGALDVLMSEGLAQRLADAEFKVSDLKTLLSYAEVQSRLGAAVWSELKTAKANEIDSLRRNLQREHLRRLAAGLLRPASAAAADVRAVNRQQALQLESDLKAAQARGGWSPTARAHLGDSLATLSEALKAPLVKQGV
jgi:predicted Zn-dependent protease